MIRTCTSCGKRNRVPLRHLADAGKCGKCKATLAPLSKPLDVGPAELDEIASTARVPILVDFWASWCGPCRMAAPQVARVASNSAGKAIVLKVDTEKHPQLAARYGVTGIPNFVVLDNGAVSFQRAGVVDHREMSKWLAR